MTNQQEELRARLQERANTAAHEGEAVAVEIGPHPGAAAWFAGIRFAGHDGIEETMSATGRSPEEACQNVEFPLGARILTNQRREYRGFARLVAENVNAALPDTDIPGNDGPTGVYLWRRDDRRAQMQHGGVNRVLLHLWSDSGVHRSAILSGYDDATQDRLVAEITKFLNGGA